MVLAMLIRSAGPVAQYLVVEQLEVHLRLPGGSGETHPVRLVHHGDDPTSTANRLVSGDLFHFESLKQNRNVVLSDVVWGRFPGEIVEYMCVNPAEKYFGMSPWSWGLAQGLQRCTETRRRASAPGMSEGRSKYRSLAPRGEPSGVSTGVQRPPARTL